MYRGTLPLTHRPARDGSIVEMAHVPAYLAMELASHAWAGALSHTSAGRFTAVDVMIVNITSNFFRELLVGVADVEVSVTEVGRSSFAVDVAIDQHGERAALASFTLVRVVDGSASPLTEDHRRVLDTLRTKT